MQALFSEHWHAVQHICPRLRDHIQILPRRLRGRNWLILHDPISHKFVRITPQSWKIVQLMDGFRDLNQIWDMACAVAADQQQKQPQRVISQDELVQLLGQLYSNDLIQTQVSFDADDMQRRYKKQKWNKFKQSYLNPLSIKIPLIYPDGWFSKRQAFATRLFTWFSFVLWLLIVTPAAFLGWEHWDELTNNLPDRVLSSSNLLLLWLTYPVVKAIHECAHGLAVKAWGGAVREMGLMFILFMPIPYVDASASYRFPSKWARATVAAVGIMAELLLGAIAIYVWLQVEPGLIRAIAFNVLFICGVSTVLVNGNPLMRYDGYFILSDLIEIPNLAQRSTKFWVYCSDRYIFGATDAKLPFGSERERGWLAVYGLVSPIYRLIIMIGLIWFVAQQYFMVGVILAIITGFLTLILPLWKGWKHVFRGSSLARYREQAQRRFYALIASILVLLFMIPVPFYSLQQGVVWMPEQMVIRVPVSGHLEVMQVTPDQMVTARQPLMTLQNTQLSTEVAIAEQQFLLTLAKIRQIELTDPNKSRQMQAELAAKQQKWQVLQADTQKLQVNAAQAGLWIPAQPDMKTGLYLEKGAVAGYIIDRPPQQVRIAVTQDDHALIQARMRQVEIRLNNDMSRTWSANIIHTTPQGSKELISPALSVSAGGRIATDPTDGKGTTSLDRVFDMTLKVDQPLPSDTFGDRAYVKFDLGFAPIGLQWLLRLKQMLLEKFYV